MIKQAVAAVIKDGERILLHKRSEKSRGQAGKWENAGGEVEKGETPEQAIVREIKEELDVDFTPIRVMYEDEFQNGSETWHVTVFGGKIIGDSRIVSDKISGDLKWFEISELVNVDLATYTRQDFVKFGWIKK